MKQPQGDKRTETLAKAKEEVKKEEPVKVEEPVKQERFQVGDKVQAAFKMRDGTEKMYSGVIKKLNPKTYHVLWEDGALVTDMKHDEMEKYVEEPKKEKPVDADIKEGDKVKGEFKTSSGSKKWYEGTVEKITPKRYWVLWSDGAKLLMKKDEVVKI